MVRKNGISEQLRRPDAYRPSAAPYHVFVHDDEGPRFSDRRDAGRRLAEALAGERHDDAVVLGLARGGVEVAAEVARALGLPLDAIAVRKVGHPLQPEYALGAVAPDGTAVIRDRAGVPEAHLQALVEDARRRAAELDARLHASRPRLDVAGRRCLLIDDGLATGATMKAAIAFARAGGASRVVVAVPVGSPDTVAELAADADQVICLETPDPLWAIGLWYDRFDQVSDEEVQALLADALPNAVRRQGVRIPVEAVELMADLAVPAAAHGLVLFSHGSGSGRFSPRNRLVARTLNRRGIATLLLDLLTVDEEPDRRLVFDIELLASRLTGAVRWARSFEETRSLPIGLFGASTGAAAALIAAAELPDVVRAVVSRGGRPDLARARLPEVRAPTLLIVGGADELVLELNREALTELRCERELTVVPAATHLFEEPGALERVAELASEWFVRYLR
jgi:putative phosphoribosyl transferase